MRCPYCDVTIYRENDMKEHIDWQHWNEPGYMSWMNQDLSRFFSVDENGQPIIPVHEQIPETPQDESCNLPFGPNSNVEFVDGKPQFKKLY